MRHFHALACALLLFCSLAIGGERASAPLTLQRAELMTADGARAVDLPHALAAGDFLEPGSRVRYRLDVVLAQPPQRPLGILVPKMSLSGRVWLNGERVGSCDRGELERLRCLHQPQFFEVPSALWRAGSNRLEFELYATARQTNGLSEVQVGDAEALHDDVYRWQRWLKVDALIGLTWLSTLLGLLALVVGLILRRNSMYLWFGITSLVNALASLNGFVSRPLVDIDLFNWIVFSSRLVSVPLSFLTVLAIFERDLPRLRLGLLAFVVLAPAAIWLSGNSRNLTFALYAPLVLSCPLLIWQTLRWTAVSRQPLHMLASLALIVLFSGGVFDWMRLAGLTKFQGSYLSAYGYSVMLTTMGFLLLRRLATALEQSLELGRRLEKQVAERMAYEVTENIPVGTYNMVLRPGEPVARFSFMSRRFIELTGIERETALRDTFEAMRSCLHPDDLDSWWRLHLEAFAHRRALSGSARLVVDGEVRWITAESVPRALSDGSTIWEGVLFDETERVLATDAAERDRAALQAHLLEQSRQQERERLLQDMHDGFGSQLTSARLLAEQGRIAPEQLPAILEECVSDLHLVVDTLNQSGGSLADAFADWRWRTERRTAHLPLRLHWRLELDALPELPQRTVLQILRIVQEAFNNALKHARASNVWIEAECLQPCGRLRVLVRDDGVGLPQPLRGGRGLRNIEQRARLIGAGLEIGSTDSGAQIALEMPLELRPG